MRQFTEDECLFNKYFCVLFQIRNKNPTFDTIPSDITFAPDKVLLKDIPFFSVMVVHLATLKSELQKEMKDVKLTKEIESKIAFINSRLSILKTYAENFKVVFILASRVNNFLVVFMKVF